MIHTYFNSYTNSIPKAFVTLKPKKVYMIKGLK